MKKKTALLVCDHVQPQFRIEHGAYPEMFKNLFPELQFESFFVCDDYFPHIDDFETFIISGSKLSVYDDIKWIQDLVDYTKLAFDKKKKILGVCFGHQLIAEALGGKVEKAKEGYLIGVHEFELIVKEQWMEPYQSPINILMLCQDQVTKLPPNSIILARSIDCPVSMFKMDDRILGIQGHPEFTKEYNKAVFESRIGKIGQDKVDQANASFVNEVDTRLMQRYLTKFLLSDMGERRF